jgi:hypothetical protein
MRNWFLLSLFPSYLRVNPFFFSQYELQTLLIDRKFAIHKFVYCLFVLACLIVLTQKEGHHSIARQHVLEYTLLSIPVFIN